MAEKTEDENWKKIIQFSQEFMENKGDEFLKQLESDLDCASLCETPLFYVARDVKDGPPT